MKKILFSFSLIFLSSVSSAGTLNIQSGAVLKGSGAVSGGDTSMLAGGELSPGDDGYGCLATDTLTFASGASLALEISGTTACSEYDQVSVTGNVNLNSATLNLDLSSYPDEGISGDAFTLIDNDGSDAITGTFDGLPEGSAIAHAGLYRLLISYVGGDGNDVSLTTSYDQSITFDAIADQEYGNAVVLSASASSGQTVSFTSDSATICDVSGSTVTLLDLGTCTITASQSGGGYYNAAEATQSFTVSQGNQTITFAALADREFSDGGFNVSASSDSGLGVTLVSDTPSVCSLSGSTLSLLDTGACSLTASQDGSYFYQPASSVTRSFTITSDNPDDDNDGVADENDAFPLDPGESADSDGDGVGDNSDAFPNDPNESADNDGDGVGDNADTDDDNDGVIDELDAFPFDPDETTDSDADGVGDNSDAFPNDDTETADSDADGVGDNADVDVDGDGLIEISSVTELYNIRNKVNGTAYNDGSGDNSSGCGDGVTVTACSGYELTQDIDFDEDGDGDIADEAYFNDNAGWDPIGGSSNRFTATFEGNGFSIANLYINRPDENYAGLFAYSLSNTFRNVSISGSVSGQDNVGLLCGTCYNIVISDVAVSGSVSGDDDVGGIGGFTSTTNASALRMDGSIVATGSQSGGLFGNADGFVVSDAVFVGSLTGGDEVGGLAGYSAYYKISDSYVDATISASGDQVGGMLGYVHTSFTSYIENSFALGSVTGVSRVGGLIGEFDKDVKTLTLRDSFARNDVSGEQYVGGLVGYGVDSFNLYRVYAAGSVTASSDGGGLVGSSSSALSVQEAYWDTDVSGLTSTFTGDGTGLTTTELQCPTAPADAACATSVYSTWDSAEWHFGTASQYPALIIDDVIYRDDDDDGVWESEDAFPDDGDESADNDGDGIGDNADTDDDNDGVEDGSDAFPFDADESSDNDGDGVGDNADTDDDNDGVEDGSDAFPFDAGESADNDGDGIGDNADPDDDNDGVEDDSDTFPFDAGESADNDGDGVGDNADTDDDNDGVEDSSDAFPFDADESADNDGDGVGDNADTDDDNDGVEDGSDTFPFDAGESADNDGDGIGDNADADDDNDGVEDGSDAFPFDADESADNDGDGVGDNADTDDDNDGVEDSSDAFPFDADESADNDGDGVGDNADTDDDNDGVEDSSDAFPFDADESADNDGDGIGDNADTDDDNDGVEDSSDAFPFDADESSDNDGDGIGDNADTDDDNDGVEDSSDAFPFDADESADNDGDGVGDNADTDDDNDGVEDASDAFPFDADESADNDADGIGDNADTDDDNDGWSDADEVTCGSDELDTDSVPADNDSDAVCDVSDVDMDNDGLIEVADETSLNAIRDDLAGTSLSGVTAGCPDSGCIGYELTADLDLLAAGYDNWLPLGSALAPFTALFEGNGYGISNLVIDSSDDAVGLFGALYGASVTNLTLAGDSLDVQGNIHVGALAGYVDSSVIDTVSVTGSVSGAGYVGGLLGAGSDSQIRNSLVRGDVTGGQYVGGLSGSATDLSIVTSFSHADVSGSASVGGLLGEAYDGSNSITDSYASGTVSADAGVASVGGLIGDVFGGIASLTRSYARTDTVIDGGGLVGTDSASGLSASSSYWDSERSAVVISAANQGEAYTSAELTCPTEPGDVACTTVLFSDWDSSIWDFGTEVNYPVLIIGAAILRDTDGDYQWDADDEDDDNDGISDGDEALAGTNPWLADTDGDGSNDSDDIWPLDASESADSDGDGVGDNSDAFADNDAASVDDDEDGLPDAWNSDCDSSCQSDSGLTLDSRLDDTDNDGLVNGEDGVDGDNNPPVVIAPEDMEVVSNGATTSLDLGSASAYDIVDGDLEPVPSSGDSLVELEPGRHVITWVATDAAGNVGSAEQIVDVIPLAGFDVDTQTVSEGSLVSVTVTLNGDAVSYPVIVPLQLDAASTAINPDDHDGETVTLQIEEDADPANTATYQFVAGDQDGTTGEADETVIFNLLIDNGLDEIANAEVDSERALHVVTLTERNLVPEIVGVIAMQNGVEVDTIDLNGGTVTLVVEVEDGNPQDSHSVEWSSESLGLFAYEAGTSLEIDISSVPSGDWSLTVIATDDDDTPLSSDPFSVTMNAQALDNSASGGAGSSGGGSWPGGLLMLLLSMAVRKRAAFSRK